MVVVERHMVAMKHQVVARLFQLDRRNKYIKIFEIGYTDFG